ncbi:glycosyltransferase [Natrarchaeobius chitinivorans]|uniref:Glycosyltransferase n=1 Tax=Natrarchaeobius chitinivorans TaxID=1679083 RepID=A0A3N6LXT2_NATCH|nr:glycosyltransferase [Natrarchaeobius chitinivorans]RQG93827.1 glycosyltransferase [Natrarchaeobius chitinivorans]
MTANLPRFSVLMSVYHDETADHVRVALESVFDQTTPPDEVLIVEDGPLSPDLEALISTFETRYPETVRTISLPTNRGLGVALRTGVEACSNELIARMDADDVAVETRFQDQLAYLSDNPEVDVLGGYVMEFDSNPNESGRVRDVPSDAEQVRSVARFRCPVNHPTVMFRREAVLEVGNYRSFRSMQDYELWMRMLSEGYTIENLPTVLVKCRTGNDLFDRRGGLGYARTEFRIQREFLERGSVSPLVFLLNVAIRTPLRLTPNAVRKRVYQAFLRS